MSEIKDSVSLSIIIVKYSSKFIKNTWNVSKRVCINRFRIASNLLCFDILFHSHLSICIFVRVARVQMCFFFLYNFHIKCYNCSYTQSHMYINNNCFNYKLITQLHGDGSLVYSLVLMYNTSETITAMNDVRSHMNSSRFFTNVGIVIISYFIGHRLIIYNSDDDAMILLALPVLPIGN